MDGFIIVDLPPEEAALEGVLGVARRRPAALWATCPHRTDDDRRTDVFADAAAREAAALLRSALVSPEHKVRP